MSSLLLLRPPPSSTLFPYTTLFRSEIGLCWGHAARTASNTSRGNRIRLASDPPYASVRRFVRSEEHTSELQSRVDLVCRLLLEKKKAPDQSPAPPPSASPPPRRRGR